MPWLKSSEDAVFWISGKPGSGKSTVMNHIAVDNAGRCKELLQNSKKTDVWLVIYFFFDFRGKDGMTNSLEGLFRSVLLQLAAGCSEVRIFIGHESRDQSVKHYVTQMSTKGLLELLKKSIEKCDRSICLFVDGLDEFTGGHRGLVTVLEALVTTKLSKICFASRPYLAIERKLERYPHIYMQRWNAPTIEHMTRSMLTSDSGYPWQPGQLNLVIIRVTESAKGVIIWAYLVCRELSGLLMEQATPQELLQRLEVCPSELNGMYQRLLESVDEASREEAALVLWLVCTYRHGQVWLSLLIDTLCFVQKKGWLPTFPETRPTDSGMRLRLQNRLPGLLDFFEVETELPSPPDFRKIGISEVRLLHKTTSKFLLSSSWVKSYLPNTLRLNSHEVWTFLSATYVVEENEVEAQALLVHALLKRDPRQRLANKPPIPDSFPAYAIWTLPRDDPAPLTRDMEELYYEALTSANMSHFGRSCHAQDYVALHQKSPSLSPEEWALLLTVSLSNYKVAETLYQRSSRCYSSDLQYLMLTRGMVWVHHNEFGNPDCEGEMRRWAQRFRAAVSTEVVVMTILRLDG